MLLGVPSSAICGKAAFTIRPVVLWTPLFQSISAALPNCVSTPSIFTMVRACSAGLKVTCPSRLSFASCRHWSTSAHRRLALRRTSQRTPLSLSLSSGPLVAANWTDVMTGTTFFRVAMTWMMQTMMWTVAFLAANGMMIRMGLPMRDPSALLVHPSVAGRHLPVRITTTTLSLQMVWLSNTRQMNMGLQVMCSWALQVVVQGTTSPGPGVVLARPRDPRILFTISPRLSGSRRLLPPRCHQAVQGTLVRVPLACPFAFSPEFSVHVVQHLSRPCLPRPAPHLTSPRHRLLARSRGLTPALFMKVINPSLFAIFCASASSLIFVSVFRGIFQYNRRRWLPRLRSR